MDCDFQRGKRLGQQWLKRNSYYSYVLTCSVDSFGFFFFFPPSAVVVNFIGTKKSNWSFELFLISFLSHIFIIVINFCLYIGILQFCEVFFFFLFSFFNFNFLNLLFFTFIPLFAFPTVLFSLQLIFNVYESSSASLALHIYSFFFSFFPFFPTYLLVLFSLLFSPFVTLL